MAGEAVKSLFGELFGAVRNVAPVPYVRSAPYTKWNSQGRDDPEAQMRSMGAVGTLFAIVNKTSTATAEVDWHLHKASPGSICEVCDAREVEHVDQHPALTVWNNPNDFYTRQEFVETEQQHIDLTGEGWWVVYRVGTRPVELWPVAPHRMEPVKDPKLFTVGYLYTDPDGNKIPLDRSEVVQLRTPNPLDPWRGMGPVQSMLANIDGLRYSADWNRNFFLNGAVPSGVIEFPDGIEDEEWEQFKTRWRENHNGVGNAHRVATIEKGKWVNNTYTMRDMQFAELREVGRKEMREAFGIHGHVLGLSEDINKANAEAADVSFARHLIVPRARRFQQALNKDFLPMFGKSLSRGYSFEFTNPVPEDREADNAERTSKATAYATLVTAGVDPDDAAAVVGLPPMRTREVVTTSARPEQAPKSG
jgi:HK97 family phage portal protein